MSIKQLEYSALGEPVRLSDIKSHVRTLATSVSATTYLVFGVMALLIFLILGPAMVTAITSSQTPAIFAALAMGSVALGVLGAGAAGIYVLLRRRVVLTRLAERNGIEYKYNITEPEYPGVIFSAGDTRTIADVFVEPSEKWEIGNYKYVIGSGKNRRTVDFGYARIKLARQLPHLLLDSKKNNSWFVSNLPVSFVKSQQVQLEGNFNDFFTVYAPDGYGTDVRYVLTPDVMQELISHDMVYDIELVDDNLFLYFEKTTRLDRKEDLERVLMLLGRLFMQIGKQAERYGDDRAAAQAVVVDGVVSNVAPQGRRLRSRVTFATIILVGYLVGVIVAPLLEPFFQVESGDFRAVLIFGISLVVAAAYAAWLKYNNRL